jgi:hypothetical protein
MEPQSHQSTPTEPGLPPGGAPPTEPGVPPGGATRNGIRDAASESVRAGVDIRARVHDLTMLALNSRRFDRHGVREVVGAVTDGLALGAEESRGELRQALSEAFRGLDDALRRSAEAGGAALRQFVATGKDFSDTEFKQTLATMKQLEDDFLTAAAHAADAASEKVRPELRQLIDTARTSGTDTGKAVAMTFTELAQRFSVAWLDVTLAGLQVAGEVGMRFALVTSGVLGGIADALAERKPDSKRR